MPEIINFNSLQKVQEQREEYSMKKSDYNVHVSGSSLHLIVLRFSLLDYPLHSCFFPFSILSLLLTFLVSVRL
jgi:hypothetical protein